MGKLIIRIPDLLLLIPSLPGFASRMHADSISLEVLPDKFDIKRHSHSILYIQSIRQIHGTR